MIRLVSKHNRHNSCVRRNHFKDGVRSDSRVRDGISTEIFPPKKKILVRRDPPKRTFGDPEHAIPIIVILYRLITKFNQ